MNYDLSENNILFTRLQRGIKSVSYGTDILLVNDSPEHELELVYLVDGKETKQFISYNDIINISYKTMMSVSNSEHKTEEHDTKSLLLSYAVFGSNPVVALFAQKGLKNLFDVVSGNYDKVNLDKKYQIDIDYILDGEEKKIIFISENSPEEFINLLNSYKS